MCRNRLNPPFYFKQLIKKALKELKKNSFALKDYVFSPQFEKLNLIYGSQMAIFNFFLYLYYSRQT